MQVSESSVGQKRAVLIGVNHYYLDNAIGNLNYCVNDVKELDSILSDENRGNFSTVVLCSDSQDNKLAPTRSNILAMIKLLANNSNEDDTILVYFAGHGFEREGINYVLPADARIDVISDTSITIKWIKDALSESLAKKKILVMDACHAGARIGRASSLPMTRTFEEELYKQSEGFAILGSCKMNQVSYDFEDKKHGAFSYFLLEGLQGAADINQDGIITIPDANNYIAAKIREWCLEQGLQQNPTLSYNVAGDFIFVKVPKEKNSALSASFKLKKVTKNYQEDVTQICELIEDLSFTSYEEFSSDDKSVDQLSALILEEADQMEKTEKAKVFLKALSERRFSEKFVKEPLMTLASKCVELREIKRWMIVEERVRKFLIIEFVNSYNFDFAGTMAHIIEKLLPTFSDDEILYIVRNIKANDQITSSFKARSSLISIVDSCKGLIPFGEYMELRKGILGS